MPIYSAQEYYAREVNKPEPYPLANDCATSNYPRLIHTEDTWRFLQTVFYEETLARTSYHHVLLARHRHLPYSSLDRSLVSVGDDGERGRSVYASRDIARGTRLWNGEAWQRVTNAYWNSTAKVQSFLQRLPHDLQCDVLLWAFANGGSNRENNGIGNNSHGNNSSHGIGSSNNNNNNNNNNNTTNSTSKSNSTSNSTWWWERDTNYVECNLDEASYFNHGERPELVNLVNTGESTYAARDIAGGEELLMDYSSFIALGNESLVWWDELRGEAWRDELQHEQEQEDKHNQEQEHKHKHNQEHEKDNPHRNSTESGDGSGAAEDTCMSGYVKYGKPKPSARQQPAAPVFVDSSLLLSGSANTGATTATTTATKTTTTTTTTPWPTALAGLVLALVLARSFATPTVGLRRR